jgi:hypothetical protein
MGGRVVEGTGLENRQTCKRLEGSNPSPSASAARLNPRAHEQTFGGDHVRSTALFQGRKRLRLDDDGLIVMEAAPKRE